MMKHIAAALLLIAAIPVCALAALHPHSPQATIKIPGSAHAISFDDIGFAAPLDRVTVPAGATGALILINPADRALTIIPGVSAAPATGKHRHAGTTSAMYAEGYLFASDHAPAEVVTIDPRTHAILARMTPAGETGYVRHVARTHEVWVTEPDQQQIQVFKLAVAPKPVLTPETVIRIANGPESLAIDNRHNHAYSNLWTNKTVVMKLTAHKVLAEWPNTCERFHGIALERADRRAFVGCGAGRVVELAADQNGRILASAQAGAGIDSISYSPRFHHLYVPSTRTATLAIFNVAASGALRPTAAYRTAPGAHCVTNDDRGDVFVCDPREGTILEIDDHRTATWSHVRGHTTGIRSTQ